MTTLTKASRRLLLFLFALALFATTGGPSLVSAQSSTAPEYSVKAAFIYNFAKFVEWPGQQPEGPDDPFVLCVLGKGPVRNAFHELKDKRIKNREVELWYNEEITDPRQCKIIYISESDAGRTAEVFAAVRGKSVLTVGESPGFIQSGGVINFTSQGKKIRFRINLQAATRARLNISSQLLKLADNGEKR